MYRYRMIQIPRNIALQMKKHNGNEVANYLAGVVNQFADEGWEFQRIDSIGERVRPGWFDALLGRKAEDSLYYVITFRKLRK